MCCCFAIANLGLDASTLTYSIRESDERIWLEVGLKVRKNDFPNLMSTTNERHISEACIQCTKQMIANSCLGIIHETKADLHIGGRSFIQSSHLDTFAAIYSLCVFIGLFRTHQRRIGVYTTRHEPQPNTASRRRVYSFSRSCKWLPRRHSLSIDHHSWLAIAACIWGLGFLFFLPDCLDDVWNRPVVIIAFIWRKGRMDMRISTTWRSTPWRRKNKHEWRIYWRPKG